MEVWDARGGRECWRGRGVQGQGVGSQVVLGGVLVGVGVFWEQGCSRVRVCGWGRDWLVCLVCLKGERGERGEVCGSFGVWETVY